MTDDCMLEPLQSDGNALYVTIYLAPDQLKPRFMHVLRNSTEHVISM